MTQRTYILSFTDLTVTTFESIATELRRRDATVLRLSFKEQDACLDLGTTDSDYYRDNGCLVYQDGGGIQDIPATSIIMVLLTADSWEHERNIFRTRRHDFTNLRDIYVPGQHGTLRSV